MALVTSAGVLPVMTQHQALWEIPPGHLGKYSCRFKQALVPGALELVKRWFQNQCLLVRGKGPAEPVWDGSEVMHVAALSLPSLGADETWLADVKLHSSIL